MPAKFTHTNRAAFKTQLFQKLGDTTRTFWTDEEANIYINEALRTFAGIAQSWREQVQINVEAGDLWFNLLSDISIGQSFLSPDVTMQDLLNQINFQYIENITEITNSSLSVSLDEILNFAKDRINEFQLETGLIVNHEIIDIPAAGVNKIRLADNVLDVLRLAYIDLDEEQNPNLNYRLYKEDTDSLALNQNDTFTPVKIPRFYEQLLGDLNEIRIFPPPANLGKLDMLSIDGLNFASVFDLANIVSYTNLSHYIKWGVMLDVLTKDGIAHDDARMAYCLSRWNEGILIGKNYTTILTAEINNRAIRIDTVNNFDAYYRGWQNKTGAPFAIGLSGSNMIALNKKAVVDLALTLTIITNAYLPIDDADFIDVREEYVDALTDYCIHLASFKEGSNRLQQTKPLFENFVKVAVGHNMRLAAAGISFEILMQQTKREFKQLPRTKEEAA